MPSRRPARRRRIWRGALLLFGMLVLFAIGAVAGMIAAYGRNLPDISRMADYQPESSTRIFARNGTQLASVYKENRVWVPLSRVPVLVRDAFIANEDHNFYYHHGVDFESIVRAAFADLTHQRFQGASTITQQLARRLFLNDEVSLSRKVQEALLAIEIERYYTKEEILERYLNIIYLGAGAYGVDAAAHTYFGRGADKLTLAQAAMLAGIVAAPSDYSPFSNFSLARERQRHVLDRMVESGYVTRYEADDAYDGPLDLIVQQPAGLQGYRFPYFTTYAIAQLEHIFGKNTVEQGGLAVYTTLDERMQRLAQEAVTWGVHEAVAEGIGAHQAALVALRPSTGEILAMVGGSGFSLRNQFNRAWQAHRQPGSSFKIYDYTAAIDEGIPASTIIDDSPVSYPMGDGTQWSPMDDDNSYMGAITLRQALVFSRNIVAVKLAERVGLDRIIDYAHRMGVTSPLEANLSLALGSSGLTVLDQASGYSTLANQGLHVDPTPFRIVKDSLGQHDSRCPLSCANRRRECWNGLYHDVDLRRRNRAWDRVPQCHYRSSRGWKDGDHFELSRRMVRRLHTRPRHRGLARQRRLLTDGRIVWGKRSRANLGALHESSTGRHAQTRIPISGRGDRKSGRLRQRRLRILFEGNGTAIRVRQLDRCLR